MALLRPKPNFPICPRWNTIYRVHFRPLALSPALKYFFVRRIILGWTPNLSLLGWLEYSFPEVVHFLIMLKVNEAWLSLPNVIGILVVSLRFALVVSFIPTFTRKRM